MKINLEDQTLPPIYKRNGRECYLDSIRNKLIYVTPEETIRQKTVSYLIKELHIPDTMLTVEEHLSHYGIKSKRRADIVVHRYNETEDNVSPIAVIECKASGVLLGDRAIKQVVDYSDAIACDYVMLTDGENAFCYKYDSDNDDYISIEGLPEYNEMLQGNYSSLEQEEVPARADFDNLEQCLGDYQGFDIGMSTVTSKAIPALNLWECLLDVSHKMPSGKYRYFNLIEDYGVRLLSYGNASGGIFSGPYRSFLIEVNGNTEFVSAGISTYVTYAKPDIQKTTLNVAIDNEKNTHHSLQLVLDDNLTVIGNECIFNHHGRIGVSNLGSGRVSELLSHVYERYPQIVEKNQFYLGRLTHDKLWFMDNPEVVKFIENLITYALLRDEYRTVVKMRKDS